MSNSITKEEEVSTYVSLHLMNASASSGSSKSTFRAEPAHWSRNAKSNGIAIRHEMVALNKDVDLFCTDANNDVETDSEDEITITTSDSMYSTSSSEEEGEDLDWMVDDMKEEDEDDKSAITEMSNSIKEEEVTTYLSSRNAKSNGIANRREMAALNKDVDMFVKESLFLCKKTDNDVETDSEDEITISTCDSVYSSSSSEEEEDDMDWLVDDMEKEEVEDDKSAITEVSEVPKLDSGWWVNGEYIAWSDTESWSPSNNDCNM